MTLSEILKQVQNLTAEEKLIICEALLREIAVPLQNPREFYDDWDDTEVDSYYAAR